MPQTRFGARRMAHVWSGHARVRQPIHNPVTDYQFIVNACAEIGDVLYAVRTEDELIKIGFTTKFWHRMGALGLNHKTLDRLLFVMPGTYEDEQEIHRGFVDLRAKGREYYHPRGEVLAFVNEVRERYAIPPVFFEAA